MRRRSSTSEPFGASTTMRPTELGTEIWWIREVIRLRVPMLS